MSFILFLSNSAGELFFFFCFAFFSLLGASLVAWTVKNLLAVQETQGQSLDWEDRLGKEMATHSSILAWRIPMNRGAWRATVHGVAKSQTRLR